MFKGFVSEDEKLRLLREAWVLAFPSLMEGWGLVVMEAAACGTPAIGFKVPGVSDAINHNISGLLVNNKKEFKDSLIRILQDGNLRSRLSRGAKEWSKRFTWEASAQNFLKVIDSEVRSKYGASYFMSFWRRSYRRKFYPVYDFRAWYITRFLKPDSLLDVGCGTGLIVSKLREKGVEAYGVDISKAAISRVPPKFRRYCSVGDIRNLKFKSKSFDVVSCIDVLEHIEKSDLGRAIKECARVAKRAIYFDITSLEDILFIYSDKTHVSKLFSWQWHRILQESLGKEWRVKRGSIIPLIHHAIFVAKRKG